MVAGLHDRHHQLGKASPTRLGIFRHRRMATGIEQHVALTVAQQNARDWHFDRLAAIGIGKVDGLPHAHTSAGQQMHFHQADSRILAATARVANTLSATRLQAPTADGSAAQRRGRRCRPNGRRDRSAARILGGRGCEVDVVDAALGGSQPLESNAPPFSRAFFAIQGHASACRRSDSGSLGVPRHRSVFRPVLRAEKTDKAGNLTRDSELE